MMTRRRMIRRLAIAAAPLTLSLKHLGAPPPARLGIGMHSYGTAWAAAKRTPNQARFHNAIEFLTYAAELGAGGVQVALDFTDVPSAQAFHAKADELGVYFEAQTSLPKDKSELDRFEAAVRIAKEAGADVVRTACLGGRRYEVFASADAFREFARTSWISLQLAESVMQKHRIRLAVENHKDWRVSELTDVLNRLSSEWVGVCVDLGNSIALLEEPIAVVQALAPWAVTTHVKDIAVAESPEGFHMSEAPLGEGFLNLSGMIEILRRAAPKIRFNLEMITRDPLRIPCLTQPYWASMENVPGKDLAATLAMVRRHNAGRLPRVSPLPVAEQITIEDDNVRRCLRFAARSFGL